MSGSAAYLFADDPAAYAAESAVHARRWLAADRLVCALIRAAHAEPAEQRLPTRESHEAHAAHVQHFARVVRDSRREACRFGAAPCLRITKSLARAMSARGVLASEVEAAV